MTAMTLQAFEQWLKRYGAAWVAGDPDAVVELFSPTAAYYETPFDAPMVGAGAIRQYWTDGAKNAQTNVRFEATPITFNDRTGYARWRATFERVPSAVAVELDGVLAVTFDGHMRCEEFREWWHRRER